MNVTILKCSQVKIYYELLLFDIWLCQEQYLAGLWGYFEGYENIYEQINKLFEHIYLVTNIIHHNINC